MASEFGQQLLEKIEESRTNVNNFEWKGPKVKNDKGEFKQEKFRLVDGSDEQLTNAYKHCKTMLFNDNKKVPGRVNLLKEIADQKDRCGVELFYRDAAANGTSKFPIVDALRSAITNRNLEAGEQESLIMGDLMITSGDYERLPIPLVIDGGLDKLGRFDRSHITLTFILKQGLWFSKDEQAKFAEKFKPEFNKFDKLRVIKEELNLPEESRLYFNPQGLTYTQLKSILSLRTKKYSELSIEQLKTLRYKLLFALEDEVNLHIEQWNERMYQIQTVAKLRNLEIK